MWVVWFVLIAACPLAFGAFMGWINDKIAAFLAARKGEA